MHGQRVLLLGIESPAGVAAATALALRGSALTLLDEDLSAADALAEAMREQGCNAVVDATRPDDLDEVEAAVRRHDLVIDTSPSSAPLDVTGFDGVYLRLRSGAQTPPPGRPSGASAYVDLAYAPEHGSEPDLVRPVLVALATAAADDRFAGYVFLHASA